MSASHPSSLSPFVRLVVENGNTKVNTFGLLDSGSEATLITSSLAAVLQLDSKGSTTRLRSFHGEDPPRPVRQTSFRISAIDQSCSFVISRAFIVEELAVTRRSFAWSTMKEVWPHLRGLPLGDFNPEEVGLLVGVNVAGAFRQIQIREPGTASGPTAILTPFGWTVMGEISSQPDSLRSCRSIQLVNDATCWLRDKFSSSPDRTSAKVMQEEAAYEILRSTIRLKDGHYELGLLWKDPKVTLPDNRQSALRIMYANEARCRSDPVFRDRLIRGVEMYEQMGFARKLRPSELRGPPGRIFYLPYFLVEHPAKPDKPRLVFNASHRHLGQSLNDNLHSRPDLITPLSAVLLRFRENPVAVCMDVVKMFLQVRVKEEDQSALRYVYRRPGSSGPPETYQMLTQIFGAASSMTACIFAMRQTAIDNEGFDAVVQKLLDCFYIDNYGDSYPDDDSAIFGCSLLVQLLSLGGFELSQISSNSRKVLKSVPASSRSTPTLNLDFDHLPTERMMGLFWDCESDCFMFILKKVDQPKTKRNLSGAIGRIYDPLGFLTCVVMPLRMLLQEVWRAERATRLITKCNFWDRQLSSDVQATWRELISDWDSLKTLRIPRCIFPNQHPDSTLALHIFCDSSKVTMGTVVYLQSTTLGSIGVHFVQSRGKVAKLDPDTIPHQELKSCKMGVDLYAKVAGTLRLKVHNVFFWTDSQAVLYWIHAKKPKQPRYVDALRESILSKSTPEQSNYVPSHLNPADDITRGVKASKFTSDHRFLRGPDFLRSLQPLWPQQPADLAAREEIQVLTLSQEEEVHVMALSQEEEVVAMSIESASSLKELKRTIANNTLGNNNERSPEELHEAMLLAVKAAQAASFPEECRRLKNGQPHQRSSWLRKLVPIIDGQGVLRVGGRLQNADSLSEDSKHPIILPAEGKLTELVVLDMHHQLLHSPTARTHFALRATFWILRGEQVVGRIVRGCEECRRQRAPPMQQMMAPLPRARVTAYKPVFYNTGVDLLGPLYVTVKRSTEKRWVSLFTCLDTRAIHLELPTDLSAASFLNSFICFSSIRGRPRNMYSDNGTNLVAAERELREGFARVMEDPQIIRELADLGIHWNFNPAAAPHWGGAWERLVRSAKTALRAALGSQTVKEDVLRTALAAVTSLINGRPLTHLGVDPDDQRPLTPNHFLIGRENSRALRRMSSKKQEVTLTETAGSQPSS